jgi:hypothetical protein
MKTPLNTLQAGISFRRTWGDESTFWVKSIPKNEGSTIPDAREFVRKSGRIVTISWFFHAEADILHTPTASQALIIINITNIA